MAALSPPAPAPSPAPAAEPVGDVKKRIESGKVARGTGKNTSFNSVQEVVNNAPTRPFDETLPRSPEGLPIGEGDLDGSSAPAVDPSSEPDPVMNSEQPESTFITDTLKGTVKVAEQPITSSFSSSIYPTPQETLVPEPEGDNFDLVDETLQLPPEDLPIGEGDDLDGSNIVADIEPMIAEGEQRIQKIMGTEPLDDTITMSCAFDETQDISEALAGIRAEFAAEEKLNQTTTEPASGLISGEVYEALVTHIREIKSATNDEIKANLQEQGIAPEFLKLSLIHI